MESLLMQSKLKSMLVPSKSSYTHYQDIMQSNTGKTLTPHMYRKHWGHFTAGIDRESVTVSGVHGRYTVCWEDNDSDEDSGLENVINELNDTAHTTRAVPHPHLPPPEITINMNGYDEDVAPSQNPSDVRYMERDQMRYRYSLTPEQQQQRFQPFARDRYSLTPEQPPTNYRPTFARALPPPLEAPMPRTSHNAPRPMPPVIMPRIRTSHDPILSYQNIVWLFVMLIMFTMLQFMVMGIVVAASDEVCTLFEEDLCQSYGYNANGIVNDCEPCGQGMIIREMDDFPRCGAANSRLKEYDYQIYQNNPSRSKATPVIDGSVRIPCVVAISSKNYVITPYDDAFNYFGEERDDVKDWQCDTLRDMRCIPLIYSYDDLMDNAKDYNRGHRHRQPQQQQSQRIMFDDCASFICNDTESDSNTVHSRFIVIDSEHNNYRFQMDSAASQSPQLMNDKRFNIEMDRIRSLQHSNFYISKIDSEHNNIHVYGVQSDANSRFESTQFNLRYTSRDMTMYNVSKQHSQVIVIESDCREYDHKTRKKLLGGDAINEDKQRIIGYPRPLSKSQWASCFRIINPLNSHDTFVQEFDPNEAAFSITICPMTSHPSVTFEDSLEIETALGMVSNTIDSGQKSSVSASDAPTLICTQRIRGLPKYIVSYRGGLLVAFAKKIEFYRFQMDSAASQSPQLMNDKRFNIEMDRIRSLQHSNFYISKIDSEHNN
eukprot:895817_1